jgi:hypothetical protein
MEFKRIVKKEVDDSQGKRTVYFWETGEEIQPGLYKIRLPIAGENFKWITRPREMFIWKNQEEGIVHDMYVGREIDSLNLGDVFPHEKYKFALLKSHVGGEGMKILEKRILWDPRSGIKER